MDYFIYKDINSNTIDNLVVTSLPPISKPEMKVETIEIDGRDGDMIEELGYQSYEKVIKMFALDKIDIDYLVSWLKGSGKLILSNEPDKYYNATIFSKIDIERLIKYQEIEVEFHIQPYKYLINEEPIVLENADNLTSLETIIKNQGYEISKPIIQITGDGVISIYVNNIQVAVLELSNETIILDSLSEDAYFEGLLKNNKMTGVFPLLNPGDNVLKIEGNVSKVIIEAKSRWL